ncbi:MAG: hypothetical protein DMC60_06105 [Verrucomicrobia bacterium]|nr:MAG: hypothetical protein DMC60_06105 [Verrucomicrobiota bacterium]
MRYLVKARVKSGREPHLVRAIDDATLGKGSIAGDEYLRNMAGEAISRSSLASAQRAGRLGGLETGASCLHLSLLVIPSSFGIRISSL